MSVTWLHISDFHVRSGDPYDRDVVLRALVKSIAEYRTRGRAPDVIFATGDMAHSGKSQEYELAATFFDDLLDATGLNKRRLFVIPGNHDVDRDQGIGLARTLDSREQSDAYFRPDRPKPHLTLKLRAFVDWHNQYFDGIRAVPETSTCGPAELLEVNGRRLGILPINTALFCQDDEDHDKLWIGRRCLDAALSDLRKLDSEFNIALLHHPLDWLSPTELSNIQAELESSVHILLRGHLHETRIESVASAEGETLRCAAGAAYQSRKWPNRALYGRLEGSRLAIYPIRYEDAPTEIWTTDPSVFPREDTHEKSFQIPRLRPGLNLVKPEQQPSIPPPPATPLRFRSNIASRGNRPFVGRNHLIAHIETILSDPTRESVVVLHGPPGVGKSELAREFARLHRDRYTSGTFLVDASKDAIAIHLAGIGKNILDLDFPADLPLTDQGLQTFHALGAAPALLIYDNVQAFDRVSPWLPLSGMPCHVLVTMLVDSSDWAWPCLHVEPLSRVESLELVERLTGGQLPAHFSHAIVEHAGGLPVQIVPQASTLAYEQRRGRLKLASLPLAREAGHSFQAAYDRLEQPARLLLHTAAFLNPQHIPRGELSRHLSRGLSWNDSEVARTLDTCLDLHLLDGAPDPSMHQLFSEFLRETRPSSEDQAAIALVRLVQAKRFVELANAVFANPADIQTAATLLDYPLAPQNWIALGATFSVEDGSIIGQALFEIGRYEEAQPWFEGSVAQKQKGRIDHDSLSRSLYEVGRCLSRLDRYEEARRWFERAVLEAAQGDLHSRIDHDNVGRSLHQVGYCLSSTGPYEEARPWFERAVAEKEKGNRQGRIDYASLGTSVHQVGYCLSSTGRYDEARPWFERAAAEIAKGDLHGRINHESVGISLHQVGYCLSSTDRFDEARPWFERAVAEEEKGDIHGRIDHASLARALHQVGYCLSRTGQHTEARPWFERAVAAAEKGDMHGRIDRLSLQITLRATAACLRELGEAAQADAYDRRATELSPSSSAASA